MVSYAAGSRRFRSVVFVSRGPIAITTISAVTICVYGVPFTGGCGARLSSRVSVSSSHAGVTVATTRVGGAIYASIFSRRTPKAAPVTPRGVSVVKTRGTSIRPAIFRPGYRFARCTTGPAGQPSRGFTTGPAGPRFSTAIGGAIRATRSGVCIAICPVCPSFAPATAEAACRRTRFGKGGLSRAPSVGAS